MPLPNHCLMCGKPVQEDDMFCKRCDSDDEDRVGVINEPDPDLDLDIDLDLV